MSRDNFGIIFGIVVIIALAASIFFFANFYSNCQDNGGSVGILFSGEGGFKCTDSDGRLMDIY